MAASRVADSARGTGARAKVEAYLVDHPGKLVTTSGVAGRLGISESTASRALVALRRTLSGLEKRGRGRYVYLPDDRKTLPDRPMALVPPLPLEAAPQYFEAVTTHRSGAVVLRDGNQDLWVAYPIATEPQVLDRRDRARASLAR